MPPALVQGQQRDASLSAYSASKLALLQFSTLLREALPGAREANLVVHDCHPGLVWTPLLQRAYGSRLSRWLERRPWLRSRIARSPEQGAQTILAAALSATDGSNGGVTEAGGGGNAGKLVLAVDTTEERQASAAAAAAAAAAEATRGGRTRRRTYFINGAPASSPRAQSPESLSLERARETWTDVLADAVQPAVVAVDVTRRTRGADPRALRFSLYAFERGYRVDGETGRVEAV